MCTLHTYQGIVRLVWPHLVSKGLRTENEAGRVACVCEVALHVLVDRQSRDW